MRIRNLVLITFLPIIIILSLENVSGQSIEDTQPDTSVVVESYLYDSQGELIEFVIINSNSSQNQNFPVVTQVMIDPLYQEEVSWRVVASLGCTRQTLYIDDPWYYWWSNNRNMSAISKGTGISFGQPEFTRIVFDYAVDITGCAQTSNRWAEISIAIELSSGHGTNQISLHSESRSDTAYHSSIFSKTYCTVFVEDSSSPEIGSESANDCPSQPIQTSISTNSDHPWTVNISMISEIKEQQYPGVHTLSRLKAIMNNAELTIKY